MAESSDAIILRIFVSSLDKCDHKPLYEAIVDKARSCGIAGATVIRGIMGFCKSGCIHTTTIFRLTQDMPIIIEIIDTPERIDAFLPSLDAMIEDGLVTVTKARVISCRPGRA